jgi:serine/threonine protein kinase
VELLATDRYGIIDELGSGAMGKVYLAQDLLLNERVAIKILRKDLLHDEQSQKRFLREISLTRKVTHPNVVRTFEAGLYSDQYFISMEFIPGVTLKDYLNENPLPSDEVLHIFSQIAKGLSAIHAEEIIHRDLKLTNIIVTPDKQVKITDFGIARPKTSELTTQDDMLGTATHMAPEIWKGDEATKQTDLYSLGVILYELVTGILPFNSSSPMELMYSHLHVKPTPPKNIVDNCPDFLNSLAVDLLEKERDKRISSIEEVLWRLENKVETETFEPLVLFSDPKTLDDDLPKIVPKIKMTNKERVKTRFSLKSPITFISSLVLFGSGSFYALKWLGDFYSQLVSLGGLLAAYVWGVGVIYLTGLLLSAPFGAIVSARFGILSGFTNWLAYSCLPFLWGLISATWYFKDNFVDAPSLIVSLISDATKRGVEYICSLPVIQSPYSSEIAPIIFCFSTMIIFKNRAIRGKTNILLALLVFLSIGAYQFIPWPLYKMPMGPISVNLNIALVVWLTSVAVLLRRKAGFSEG